MSSQFESTLWRKSGTMGDLSIRPFESAVSPSTAAFFGVSEGQISPIGPSSATRFRTFFIVPCARPSICPLATNVSRSSPTVVGRRLCISSCRPIIWLIMAVSSFSLLIDEFFLAHSRKISLSANFRCLPICFSTQYVRRGMPNWVRAILRSFSPFCFIFESDTAITEMC